jgi:hypothetical protein
MKPHIVGLTGFAGAGKDTAAGYLAEALQARGKRVEIMSFAEPLRAMLRGLGVPNQYMTERQLKELDVPGFNASYRHMAQTLGTEWGRQCMGGNIWLRHLEMRIGQACAGRQVNFVFVTDVRFPNEANWVREQRGSLVHIDRPGLQRVREHVSERAALPWDHWLANDTDLGGLRSRCGHTSNALLSDSLIEA